MLKLLPKSALGIVFLAGVVCLLPVAGCGGKLATPGCVTVSQVCPNGLMLLHYPEGKCEWKRLRSDDVCKESREVAKNLYKPARVVETKKGSTITFPCGDTFIYQDLPKPCE
jgi:hypothetical protein